MTATMKTNMVGQHQYNQPSIKTNNVKISRRATHENILKPWFAGGI
jgi:hypothetical protein